MSDFEKGFYWLKFNNNEITIGEYTGVWYIIGTEIELISLPKDFHVIGKVSECTERQPKEALDINGVSCCFADKEILSNSLRFAITETPQDEQGALKDFKKYQAMMRKCMLWLNDNYEPPCDGFMNECEA